MGMMMLVMLLGFLAVIAGVAWIVVTLGRGRLRGPSERPADHLLKEQAERIALLEDELQRVRDQADFTEKLVSERWDKGA
ncbi:MAG: hypothetical protein GWN02_33040, partial [Gemmatimonadetes bacterium]|nr:hypothetical protein [Gemmatimonadota bacterium]